MKMVNALADTISVLLAADTTMLANATAMKVSLITQPFTPSIDRVIGDLTLDSAAPLAAVAAVAGVQLNGKNPINGNLQVEVKPPAGGFRWNTGTGFAAPVTVYGFALTNGGITTLYGTKSLNPPLALNGDNQQLTAPPLIFEIDPTKIV